MRPASDAVICSKCGGFVPGCECKPVSAHVADRGKSYAYEELRARWEAAADIGRAARQERWAADFARYARETDDHAADAMRYMYETAQRYGKKG